MVLTVTHLVSGKKFTGAAAVALSWHEALLRAGHQSRFIYEGGHNLEKRLKESEGCQPYPPPLLLPGFLRRTTENTTVISHLSNDHWRQLLLSSRQRRILAFHRPSAVKPDLLHRWLYSRMSGAVLAFSGEFSPSRPSMLGSIPPAVDEKIFFPGEQPGAVPSLTTIGKLTIDRKHDRFLHLLSLLKEKGVACTGKIIGKGPYLSELKLLTEELHLTKEVTFAGYHEDASLADELRSSDILVWCAPGSQFGHRALGEAMACGCVTSAFPMEGLDCWIEDGVTGLRLNDDVGEAAEAIIALFRDMERFQVIRRAGMELATQLSSYSSVAERIVSTLSSSSS